MQAPASIVAQAAAFTETACLSLSLSLSLSTTICGGASNTFHLITPKLAWAKQH
jgi:hypothetical protein